MTEPTRGRLDRMATPRRLALALAALAGLAVLLTLDDPGMTVDEPLDVAPGRKYVRTLAARGLGFFDATTVRRVFADNAEHPPLGRWLLGLASTLGEPVELILLGKDPVGLYVRAGRAAPALAFALLAGLVAAEAGRRYGRAGGIAAGLSLVSMPRAFAHAHLGALDTFVALTWTLGLLSAARAVESRRPVAGLGPAGLAWGAAVLTKIHGWLLGPVVAAWVVARLPLRRAAPGLALWAAVGLLTFFAGWPWLWYDTAGRLSAYLRTGVERTPILVEYLGTTYRDVDVPWHYPWLYFAATVPVGLHALALAGLGFAWRGRRADPFPMLLAGAIALWLVVFSTNVAVYDGERLFLPSFPLWAILAGRGFAGLWRLANIPGAGGPTPVAADRGGSARSGPTRRGRLARAGLVAFLAAQGHGLVATHPFGLSYYNLLVGGLPGAERLGLELTYWGDAADPVLLGRLAALAGPGDPAALAPTLAPGQGAAATTRALARLPVVLGDQEAAPDAEWIVVYRRKAYWTPEIRELVRSPPVALRARQGVWLSGLWHRPRKKSSGSD
jgi:hypothetical protein